MQQLHNQIKHGLNTNFLTINVSFLTRKSHNHQQCMFQICNHKIQNPTTIFKLETVIPKKIIMGGISGSPGSDPSMLQNKKNDLIQEIPGCIFIHNL